MLAAFEELWAAGWSLLPPLGPSFAPPLPLVTPLIAVPPAVPVAVSVTSAAASSARSGSSSDLAASSSQSCELSWPVARLSLDQFPSVPASASRGSLSCSWSHLPFGPIPRPRLLLAWLPLPVLGQSDHHPTSCGQVSHRSSSLQRSCDRSSSRSRPKSHAWVQASSSNVVPSAVELCSPLDIVQASYSS